MTLFISFLLIIAFFVWRRSKMDSLSKNIIFAYVAIWLVSLLISTLGIQNFPVIKFKTLLFQLVHILFFYIGYKLVTIRTTSDLNRTSITISLDKMINNKIFVVIISLFAIYSVYLLTQYYLVALLIDDLSDVRGAYYERELYGHFFHSTQGFLLEPLNILCLFTFAYSILFKPSLSGVISLVAVLAYNTLSGGRFGYVTIPEAMLFVVFCFQQHALKLKQVLIFFAAFLALFVILSIVSAGRTGSMIGDSNAWESGKEVAQEHVMSYLGVPNLAFEYALDNNYREKIGGYQFGLLTGASIEGWFYSLMKKFGWQYSRPCARLDELIQVDYIPLGPNSWNALYTSSLYYYLDFGFLGLILFPFFFGLFARVIVRKLYQKQSIYFYFLLGFIFLKMLFSVEMYSCIDIYFPVIVVFLYILGNRNHCEC